MAFEQGLARPELGEHVFFLHGLTFPHGARCAQMTVPERHFSTR